MPTEGFHWEASFQLIYQPAGSVDINKSARVRPEALVVTLMSLDGSPFLWCVLGTDGDVKDAVDPNHSRCIGNNEKKKMRRDGNRWREREASLDYGKHGRVK